MYLENKKERKMKYIAIVGGDRTDFARVDEVIMKEVEAKQFFLFTVLCNQAAPASLSKDWADLRGCPVEYIKVNSLENEARELEEARKKRIPLGFAVNEEKSSDEVTYTITPQDYVDDGLSREFFGRGKVITCTNTYTYEDLKNILMNSTISPLKNFEKTVKMFGYSGISYTDEFIDALCNQALEMNTGARALQTLMSGVQNKLLIELINKTYDLDKPIELTPNLINDYNSKYLFNKL